MYHNYEIKAKPPGAGPFKFTFRDVMHIRYIQQILLTARFYAARLIK